MKWKSRKVENRAQREPCPSRCFCLRTYVLTLSMSLAWQGLRHLGRAVEWGANSGIKSAGGHFPLWLGSVARDGEIASCPNPQFSPVKWTPGMEDVLREAPLVSGTQHLPRQGSLWWPVALCWLLTLVCLCALLSSGVQAAFFVWSLIVPVCSTEVKLSSLDHLSPLEESPS